MDESWGFFSSINRILRHLLPFTGHRSRKTKERNTKQIFPWTENKEVFCFTSSLSGTRCFDLGRFSIQQKFRFEISEISRANETVHIRCTDPTQATAHLVIVLVIIQKSGTGDNDFVKGHFGPTDRNDQSGQSGPPSKLVLNILVGPNRNGPFHSMYQPKFPEFGVEWKTPLYFAERRFAGISMAPPSF